MANKFRILKDGKKVVEGQNPVTLTGVGANKTVADGEYKYCLVNDKDEVISQTADVQGWKTLAIAATGVTLDKTTLALKVGTIGDLKATVAPTNATDKGVTWTSSAAAIVTVDGSGKVTAIKAGTATITVTTKSGSKTATCTVTVTEPDPAPEG